VIRSNTRRQKADFFTHVHEGLRLSQRVLTVMDICVHKHLSGEGPPPALQQFSVEDIRIHQGSLLAGARTDLRVALDRSQGQCCHCWWNFQLDWGSAATVHAGMFITFLAFGALLMCQCLCHRLAPVKAKCFYVTF
jgi:hypothetical protein